MAKKVFWYWYIIILLVAIPLFFGNKSSKLEDDSMIVTKYFDSEGKEIIGHSISTIPFTVVNQLPNVAYIAFVVNIENLGDSLINAQISDATVTPLTSYSETFQNLLPQQTITLEPFAKKTFGQSELIPVAQFEETSQTFMIEVTGNYNFYGEQKTIIKQQTITMEFHEQKEGSFNMQVAHTGDAAVSACNGIDCNCPSTGRIENGNCCVNNELYTAGACNVGTSFCQWEITQDHPLCGGSGTYGSQQVLFRTNAVLGLPEDYAMYYGKEIGVFVSTQNPNELLSYTCLSNQGTSSSGCNEEGTEKFITRTVGYRVIQQKILGDYNTVQYCQPKSGGIYLLECSKNNNPTIPLLLSPHIDYVGREVYG